MNIEGLAEVNDMLADLSLMPKDALGFKRLALKAKEVISERTARGIDAGWRSFADYSDSYLEYKEERAGRSVDIVNLNDFDNMLDAMTVDGSNTGSRLFFSDSVNNDKALGHNEGLNGLPARVFFALNETEVDSEIIPIVEADIDRYMGNL
jgi:hypothetical protein